MAGLGVAHNYRRILVEISPGELIDKISILEIKASRVTEPDKLASIWHELELLTRVHDECIPRSDELALLSADLKTLNIALWEIEFEIRKEEQAKRFRKRFIGLARAGYRSNDRRAALKRQINILLGSAIIEEKSYVD